MNLFCYYFFGIVIQYNDKEAKLKECTSLLKEILQLDDSYSVNIMKIIEKYDDIFVDLLFKYGFIDKDMTGINQYIFDMYKTLFHSIWIFEKNKYGFITPETYTHFTKDEKGNLIQVKSHKSLFLRIFKKIFCDNLEKCRKEYSRDGLFLNLFTIITVACPESCLVSCNILLQLPSFISNNNLAEYKSAINPNLKMGNPPNLLYSCIFYEIIIRCATPWMLKNREDSPYMMLKYPQGIKNLDLSFYPKLPIDWEKILTREFFLEHILLNGTEVRPTTVEQITNAVNLVIQEFDELSQQKLAGIEAGAQVNKIEKIIFDGHEITPNENKTISITSNPHTEHINKIESIFINGREWLPNAAKQVQITIDQAALNLNVLEGAQVPGQQGAEEVSQIQKKLQLERIAVSGDVKDLKQTADTYIILDCGSSTTVI